MPGVVGKLRQDDLHHWKLRIKLEGRGKSGGGRVIYLDVLEKEKIYLLFAYPKNIQEDLTSEQRRLLRRMAEAIMEE